MFMPENSTGKLKPLVIVAIGFLIWGAVFIYMSSHVSIDGKRYFSLFDDAMISMRYAWNFSHGLGLVWNEGERVQGYTNLFMVIIMSGFSLLLSKKAAVLAIQLFGLFIMPLIAYLGVKLSEEYFRSTGGVQGARTHGLQGVFVFFGVLAYYPLVYWSLMGMETGLLALLLMTGLLCALRYVRTLQGRTIMLSALVLGLAYMARPDAAVFVFIIWVYVFVCLYRAPEKRQQIPGNFLYASMLIAFMVMAVLLFQYLYYGSIFPNTYTLKLAHMPLGERIVNGLGFLGPFFLHSFPLLLLAAGQLFLRGNGKTYLLVSLVLSAIFYQIYVGGDPWQYWRMLSPVMPIAIVLAVGVLFDGVSRWNNQLTEFATNRQVFGLLLILVLLLNWPFAGEIVFASKAYSVRANHKNIDTAVALNELSRDNASVGVFWAGTIPYYCDIRAVDFLGKSDVHIASLPPDLSGNVSWNGMNSVPGHNKYDLNYSIKTLQPTYAQELKWGGQDLSALGKSMYVGVEYKGVELNLLKDSNTVHWEKLKRPPDHNAQKI